MAYWFIFQNDHLLLNTKTQNQLIDEEALTRLKPHFLREHAIGEFNLSSCFAAEIAPEVELPKTIQTIALRKAFEVLDETWYRPAMRAFSVINWDRNHQFCGHCGSRTSHQSALFERTCLKCGLVHYPRISPSVIVLIERGDHLLMARGPHFKPGAYGLIAGFVEIGESLEETIMREVQEEVSLKVKNLRYFGSQAWPFPDSLMIGFIANHAEGEIVIDTREIEEAGWYRFDRLPGLPSSSVSISRRLIDHFVKEQTEKS